MAHSARPLSFPHTAPKPHLHSSQQKDVPTPPKPLRIAAIQFLNPAPLLYNFEHEPTRGNLLTRYKLRYTSPALCAEQLRTGEADLGLVPIGALPFLPDLVTVPGCTIASLHQVRSIQLIVKPSLSLTQIESIAADSASRSSVAYVQILLREFFHANPAFTPEPAGLPQMLALHDAALLIGDPALLALEDRDTNGTYQDHTWYDIAALWHRHTGLPWVAAVWAVRPGALHAAGISAAQLTADLNRSRDAGVACVDQIVDEWQGRIAVPASTIRAYLTRNIHYTLNAGCLASIDRFYTLAAKTGIFPTYRLMMLEA